MFHCFNYFEIIGELFDVSLELFLFSSAHRLLWNPPSSVALCKFNQKAVTFIIMVESPFSTQLKCLKVIGFHAGFDSRAKTALHVACSLLIVFVMMSELYAVVLNFNDVLAAAEAFGPFSAELICLSKFLSFYCFKRKFYSLIERVEALTGWFDDSNILTSLKFSLRALLSDCDGRERVEENHFLNIRPLHAHPAVRLRIRWTTHHGQKLLGR